MDLCGSRIGPCRNRQWTLTETLLVACVLISQYSVLVGAEILTPPYFNLAEGRHITATATCGVDTQGPELYCKLVGANAENDANVIQGQVCDYCDSERPDKRHPPEYAVDGAETWWQSPPLSRGMKYNEVNLTIDLGQEFHVAYVYVRMGNSPRPGLWALEKSSDYGKTYTPWQYFSDSPSDCETYFGADSLNPITKDDSVICSTEYSKIVPLENGEIPISLLNNRPSANHYFNSSVLQEWTRATNVRFRLLRTKNLLGHLMSVARQDPTVTRRYFYSIKDISIGGRCMCNGHADTCDIQDPRDPEKLMCRCQHNTCGPQCAKCCSGFEQKAWRQSTGSKLFVCEPCNCFNHSSECEYDAEIDARRLSLDIHGKYEGGGVCKNCQHNTEGVNCDRCQPRYYRPHGKHRNETDVCQPCNCDNNYSTGNCAEHSGQCECRKEFTPPLCDSCSYGYFGYPDCRPCECNLNATEGYHCEATDGQCPCKENFAGNFCKECAEGYYNFPECIPCECNYQGAVSNACDSVTGQCTCKPSYGERTCSQCKDGYFFYPTCSYCNCDVHGTLPSICEKNSGQCLCKEGYAGERCDQCAAGYYGYPDCQPCSCSEAGSASTVCDAGGKCPCLGNFAGRTCDQCNPGYYQYPECLSCNCDSHGAIGISCNSEGQCQCNHNFDKAQCNACKEGFYNFPNCEECNCDPAGVVAAFAGCGSVPAGQLCQCKERVHGRICDTCRPLFWNLNAYNPDGCEDCNCHIPGSMGAIGVCDTRSGQCVCKPSATGRDCAVCRDGSFNLDAGNLFGCTDCVCDVGGSVNNVCDKKTGQCLCHPRVTGQTCRQPLQTHYFPTLYQLQHEAEDGYTPANTPVRYAYDESRFPEYSWKGYAVFSQLQNEIIHNVYIQKSSVYRMVMRYVNPNPEPIVGSITITPDNPTDIEQRFQVLFKPSRTPQFVTVSGAKGDIPSPWVINPGRWFISIKNDKSLFLDYFVLLPAAFYEASILTHSVMEPCTVGTQSLCRHNRYPDISQYDVVRGEGGFVPREEYREALAHYFNDVEQLRVLKEETMPVINADQPEIHLDLTVAKPGRHVLVIDYITPRSDARPTTLGVESSTKHGRENGKVELYSCTYTTPCRQVVIDRQNRVAHFNFDTNFVSLVLKGDATSNVGIKSVVAIPHDQWSLDYIQPKPVCVQKEGKCVEATYPKPPESKKVEFETGNENQISKIRPDVIFDNSSQLIYLDNNNSMIDIKSKVPHPGYYVFIVKFYQPDYPEFDMDVLIQNGQFYEAKLPVPNCPSNSGCRSVVRQADGNNRFSLTENFVITLKESNHKSVWLDYLLVVPADQYSDTLLNEDSFDQTGEFISTCGFNHFSINITDEGFCKDAVFSLTSDYNNGALPCQCDFEGSLSFECAQFGGQCQCKPNIIGRQCEICKTGFFGFPECKPCNCPSTALCEKDTGACICPPRVTGKRCDQCQPYTFGFDAIIGCEECNCNRLGVKNNLQCDLQNGSCECKENVVGRACDKCEAGSYSFPYCKLCECDLRGTTIEICNQVDAECFCKSNVEGPACDLCKEGTFNIQESNVDGCTKCFCFGKSTRCTSSSLYKTEHADMDKWIITLIENNSTLGVLVTELEGVQPEKQNDTVIGVDLSNINPVKPKEVVYFSAPDSYLGNKLNAYGGQLNYTIYYTTGLFGSAISGADVIIQGGDNIYLLHESLEQPAAAIAYTASLEIVESKFALPSGAPATRDQIMLVLENLQGIFIRATYWESSITTRLADVSLEIATEDYFPFASQAAAVEQCRCPPNYQGLSCEECAPGYYRTTTGPHGGYCVPCQCNGHADECDVSTGVCYDCKHSTTGDHCEQCIVGYHGNATYGTPNDCLICACPLPIPSNNFATGCEVSSDGERISCECREGYYGARCQSCAAGYYGRPEQVEDICKPCQCSGNINPEDVRSCDSLTGECLLCLNNTYGKACNLCAPGYYGDAIKLKDCQSCVCDKLGTAHCDSFTGICECHPNVVGEKCDRCADDHYYFGSGRGCLSCDCAEASESSQCDDATGQCRCKPGVTGRTCDRCAPGYWQYGPEGCVSCGCNTEYSLGFGCNAETGQCECLPGVIGEKCDHCPYRWVLIEDQGCFECDSCSHDLLDVTDRLKDVIEPVSIEFQTVATGYFTSQKLIYINDTVNSLSSQVELLDPEKVDLKPITQELDSLEQDVRNLHRRAEYASENGVELIPGGAAVQIEALETLDGIRHAVLLTHGTISEVVQLANSLEMGEGRKIEAVLTEGQKILEDIKARNLSNYLVEAVSQRDKALHKLEEMKEYVKPVLNQSQAFENLRKDITKYEEKLEDMLNHTVRALDNANAATELIEDNRQNNKLESKSRTVSNQTKEYQQRLEDSKLLLKNASEIFTEAYTSLERLAREGLEVFNINNEVNKTLPKTEKDLNDLRPVLQDAARHAWELESRAAVLDEILADSRNTSHDAVLGATAYQNIVKAIEGARKAVQEAREAAQNATELTDGLDERAGDSEANAMELLNSARAAVTTTQTDLVPQLSTARADVDAITATHTSSDDLNNDINAALDRIPAEPLEPFATRAKSDAAKAAVRAQESLGIMSPIVDQLPLSVEQAKQVPKDVDETNKAIAQANTQMERISSIIPNISDLIEDVAIKQDQLQAKGADILEKIRRLKQQVADARDIANSIKVGVTFQPNTTLELKPPVNLPLLATSTRVSAFFRTEKPTGFLLYLGNEEGTKLRRTKRDDYMAIEVENGYPVLTIDLGNGPEKIINDKFVADGQWRQVIVERTGKNVKLIIREEVENGKDRLYEKEEVLSGTYSIFNLDQEQSKVFVGGFPASFQIQDTVKSSSFEGQIEEVMIGDTPVGLWNFADGQENANGAIQRDKLVDIKESATGYRFNGNGYAIIDARSYNLKNRADVQLQFKAARDSRDGLLFLAGKGRAFFSIEMRNGRIFFRFRLGKDTVTMGTDRPYNDAHWHTVEAARFGRKGQLKVDGDIISSDEAPRGTPEILHISEHMYFGGYPNQHNYTEVTNVDFDGCIDQVQISGTLVDLTRNVQSQGVKPGCPVKFARIVSFHEQYPGYLRRQNASAPNFFQLNLKFKTRAKEGVIFYATNHDQTATVSLALNDGGLVLTSQKEVLSTYPSTYNDGEWHVVTATHEKDAIKVDVDDFDHFSTDTVPPYLHIIYGDLYIGGLPSGYPLATGTIVTSRPFSGCLGDATLNGAIINFANATEKAGEVLGRCILEEDEPFVPASPGPVIPYEDFDESINAVIPEVEITEDEDITEEIFTTSTKMPEIRTTVTPTTTFAPTIFTSPVPDVNENTVIDEDTEDIPFEGGRAPPKEDLPRDDACKLPQDPDMDVTFEAGYRFGTTVNSRLEYSSLPGKYKKNFDFSIDFKTSASDGIIFYAADARHNQFVSLHVQDNKIHYAFSCGNPTVLATDPLIQDFTDDQWHTAVFSRSGNVLKLMIDDSMLAEGQAKGCSKDFGLQAPFYLGGINSQISDDVKSNIKINNTFSGCLKNLTLNGNRAGDPREIVGAIPCSEQVEPGVFFGLGGGYVKAKDKFRVGMNVEIKFYFKPRSNTGLLVSVHGKRDFLIIQMLNSTIHFSVDNGAGVISTQYVPPNPYVFCDGNWHTVEAVKVKNLLSLVVDKEHVEPYVDHNNQISTDTTRPLFIGGHPHLMRMRGIVARSPYLGCFRGLEINNLPVGLTARQAFGKVVSEVCPVK